MKPEPACTHLGAAQRVGLHRDPRADRVAVALACRRRRRASAALRPGKSLRKTRSCGAARAAITSRSGSPSQVVVEDGEGAAVLVQVEPHRARHVVEAALAVVAQEHVALVVGLGAVSASRRLMARQASSYGVPVTRVSGERAVDLAPEEAVQVGWPSRRRA